MGREGIKTNGDILDLCEDIIKTWISRHPKEWLEFKQAIGEMRAKASDAKFGENKSGDMRLLGTFPAAAKWVDSKGKSINDDLYSYIKKVIPSFDSNSDEGKKIRERFFKRFKVFTIAERI